MLNIRSKLSQFQGAFVIAIASVSISSIAIALKFSGIVQYPEIMVYDQMTRLSKDEGEDNRLLVVGITEDDISKYTWPIRDEIIAEVLQKLQQHQARVIGLDVYRHVSVEPGHKELVKQLNQPNVISIRNLDKITGITSPPEVAKNQIGFNDVVTDHDGIIRRNLLFADSPDSQDIKLKSFSLALAFKYLEKQGIEPNHSPKNPAYMQLGKAEFIMLKPESGGYQTLDSAGYQVLLKYRGINPVKEVSLIDVLENKFNPELIKDKIILIGTTAPSLKDNFYTPFSAGAKNKVKMPGVFIHAQLVSHILDASTGKRPLIWFWSENIEIAWIIFWTVITAIIASNIRHPLLIIVTSTGLLIMIISIGIAVYNFNGWIPIFTPCLSVISAFAALVTYKSDQANRQQKIIFKLLGQNTSPSVADALLKNQYSLIKDGKLPGQKATATILFSDLKNFSTISEQKTPEDLMNWLNEMLEIFTEEVLKRGGIINKFTGDGIMAAFGVPISSEDKQCIMKDTQNAVECAIAMGFALTKLNQKWESEGLATVQMRIGIFTGPVVVGSLGGKDRLEYGIIGDAVNTASRLESSEKERQPSDCRILIGDETLSYLDNKYLVESWGKLPLKGKQQLVEVYLILGKKT
jgi:adenylate cyclase